MTIRRLREYPSLEELKKLYATPHNHQRWPDHQLRVGVTTAVARWMLGYGEGMSEVGLPPVYSIADLSCGDATIARGASDDLPVARYLGDYGASYEYEGPIEETAPQLLMDREGVRVGLFVLSETIEHVEDPLRLLKLLRLVSERLVLSTPINEVGSGNPEHIWGWDHEGIRDLLGESGWEEVTQVDVTFPTWVYSYQIWGCK